MLRAVRTLARAMRTRGLPLLAALLVLGASVLRIAAAGVTFGDINCCCGVHAGDEACGCPDCPAGHHDDHDDTSDQDGPARLTACGAQVEFTAMADAQPQVMTPTIMCEPRLAIINQPCPTLQSCHGVTVRPPEPPPPRASALRHS